MTRPALMGIRKDVAPSLWTFLGEVREHRAGQYYVFVELTEKEEKDFFAWININEQE